ncbi:MAG TPA: ATP-binding cassette domain-containing protein, partial [Candidatus Saccharimonadia bacterium]|nr:ATP-binding cassette domain-containing protein [Candidatus Saccharimonadia bacterium]
KARVADLLDRFQIVGKKDLFPNQLSGGQQQLVAVARAVISKPSLLLADEPTGALHSSQGKMIMETLKQLNDEGATIVQDTHSEANAAYGNRVVELFDGWSSEPRSRDATKAARAAREGEAGMPNG